MVSQSSRAGQTLITLPQPAIIVDPWHSRVMTTTRDRIEENPGKKPHVFFANSPEAGVVLIPGLRIFDIDAV
jgi:hypothetical protein